MSGEGARSVGLGVPLDRAAEAICKAGAMLIGAGAGMGVDSGLPDFRGDDGFWKAYPPYAKLGLRFAELANPRWFGRDPEVAWGFYGHRMMLYRETAPHEGFSILRRWSERMPRGAFVFTSNVDGHFQKAGFDASRIHEVHGTITALQCLVGCGAGIFPGDEVSVRIDEETMRAARPLPSCPECGGLARPNILMFGDWGWDSSGSDAQARALNAWLRSVNDTPLAVVECGAGTAIPTVRMICEEAAARSGGTLIRINVREPEVPRGGISLPLPALAAIREIEWRLQGRGKV
ncbi:NAD-dependent protein deacylase [Aquisphaera giovannonii]|uniref:protein acetyllysine N-acetyltransferase n=1 Tax=Aquisphaera giovannonii TaxID=406548 RepID=A0A5B9W7B6_9BACT|nr:Sir2 family NAD-dependent protein deacetylase [Aquisphaera giovannonii]QEH35911.1 NAD-dependent protein deacylase [Aquisphaera giovannonii]